MNERGIDLIAWCHSSSKRVCFAVVVVVFVTVWFSFFFFQRQKKKLLSIFVINEMKWRRVMMVITEKQIKKNVIYFYETHCSQGELSKSDFHPMSWILKIFSVLPGFSIRARLCVLPLFDGACIDNMMMQSLAGGCVQICINCVILFNHPVDKNIFISEFSQNKNINVHFNTVYLHCTDDML